MNDELYRWYPHTRCRYCGVEYSNEPALILHEGKHVADQIEAEFPDIHHFGTPADEKDAIAVVAAVSKIEREARARWQRYWDSVMRAHAEAVKRL